MDEALKNEGQKQWMELDSKPAILETTLQHPLNKANMFKNIHIILLCPVTSAGVERANSSLRYTKNVYRSTMLEERLNALILLFVHRDIHPDYDKIINIYGTKHPRRMLFVNALEYDT